VETCSLMVDDGERRVTFQKLLSAVEVITCVDCYGKADVQRDRELRFRVELTGEERTADQ